MKASGGELGWLPSPSEDGWEIVQTVINGSLLYTYSVCNVGGDTEQDNWLRTTFIQRRPDVSRISVELRFIVRDCGTFGGASPSCRETFGLFLAETDSDVGTTFRKGQFRKVATVAPDEVTVDRSGGKAALRVNVETRTVGPLSRRGFYLAFQDSGACVALISVRVFYTTCPSTTKSLVTFPEKITEASLTEVVGTCVKNAVAPDQAPPPRMYCTTEGEWVVPVGQCQCGAGYQAFGEICQACEEGFFKTAVSSAPCQPCPANTQRSKPGAPFCECLGGFFRSQSDSPSTPCSAPPSAPRDLITTPLSTAGRLQLSWRPPLLTGGRSDITYSVSCEHCSGAACAPCGEKVRFEPGAAALRDPTVTVSELELHLNYTFMVEAQSGVSQYSSQRASSSITTTLHSARKPLPLGCNPSFTHLIGRSVCLPLQDDKSDQDVTTYTVLVLEKNSVQINDLSPGTKYLFRVQTLNQDGHPGSNSKEYVFQTPGKSSKTCFEHEQLKRLNLFTEKLQPLKSYVDPHTYEDPNTAVLKFTSEIHPGLITKQKVIGAGEFGEVFRGVLKKTGRAGEVAVAIKSLKPGYTEKQRQDFLSEASIMGQFTHRNIIRLEGVVTKFKPAMIITEYMENGALDIYLRLSSYQLVGMLSGIAAGMKYLSDMNYVHRDLAARNVLVNANLECKVSDFGLSRVLEDYPEGTYTTTGGKIPIRWTAPEAIAYRKFTSASDVWSFGIVMWEVMAFGERPYWDMSNHEVMKAINETFRLPAPMDCPSAVYQLMLQCWQHDRTKRPRFTDIVNVLDKLLRNPESLNTIASFDPCVSIRLPSTSGSDGAPFRSVEEWLGSMKLSQYKETFAVAGIVTMEQVLCLKPEDLKNIGVLVPGHLKRIAYSILGLRDPSGPSDVFAV
uniref:receptor protein-tyrosine kinase n=1 Tax=Denticeps clupeoides TaxID=299321 RepID=A0AAY4C3M6_9TELE